MFDASFLELYSSPQTLFSFYVYNLSSIPGQDFLEDSTKGSRKQRNSALSFGYSQPKPAAASPPAMLSASCLGLVILLILRDTYGDSVNQTEGPVILPEGAFLTLNCTYQTSYSAVLYWIQHDPECKSNPVCNFCGGEGGCNFGLCI
ncbi:hypothetical protein mRhiFer1_010169 [Rhinolophus ferrumequinum]|uniref:Ig-like domain-containing protein n=1 Tax=Rhinolophus ferrumequinum TaxID=59479 RepID=A0A7J7XPT8_RHIFE|nr:hypothetical protein mRhiFer1_010169 [Rhinolophus ferrumequinum]